MANVIANQAHITKAIRQLLSNNKRTSERSPLTPTQKFIVGDLKGLILQRDSGGKFEQLVKAIADGQPSDKALFQTFGLNLLVINQALKAYVDQPDVEGHVLSLKVNNPPVVDQAGTKVTDAQSDAVLGDLLLRRHFHLQDGGA